MKVFFANFKLRIRYTECLFNSSTKVQIIRLESAEKLKQSVQIITRGRSVISWNRIAQTFTAETGILDAAVRHVVNASKIGTSPAIRPPTSSSL